MFYSYCLYLLTLKFKISRVFAEAYKYNNKWQKVVTPLLSEKGISDDGLSLNIQKKKSYSKTAQVLNNFFPNIVLSKHFKIVLTHFQPMFHFCTP